MSQTIVEDRVLARIAFEAVGWNGAAAADLSDPAAAAALADIAYGQAVVALRVMGIGESPEIARTVRADIALLLADPAKLARARSLVARTGAPRRGAPAEAVAA